MNIKKQAQLWKYAAWTAPFTALAIILGQTFLGFDSFLNITSIVIVTVFITTSVLWWWWAVSKIVFLVQSAERVVQNFDKLSKEIKEIKKDVGNRQWREPNKD